MSDDATELRPAPAEGVTTPAPLAQLLEVLHARHGANRSGEVATYIPELADAAPDEFGICIGMVDGTVHEVGDTRREFTLQSISKPLTYGIALDALGPDAVMERIGVEPTGDPFNSIELDDQTGRAPNAMVNSGAIVAADLVRRTHGEAARAHLLEVYGRYAGRELSIDRAVAASERSTGHRNRAIAHLLRASGAIAGDPETSLDLYFDQCSVIVDCRDLAIMAATLANGGRNPLDGSLVAGRATVSHLLTVMATCGMYDGAGSWLISVGLPAKSGVSGGIIAVLPGQFGIGVFSPPLDDHGNSVRGMQVCRDLTRELGLGMMPTARHDRSRHIDLDVRGDVLEIILRNDVEFTDAELITRRLMALVDTDDEPGPSGVIIDISDCDTVHDAFPTLLGSVAAAVAAHGGRVVISGGRLHPDFVTRLTAVDGGTSLLVDGLDDARAWCATLLDDPRS